MTVIRSALFTHSFAFGKAKCSGLLHELAHPVPAQCTLPEGQLEAQPPLYAF